ncbi:BON domain-containing protein [Psychrosphaera ytuae]|uniref:BON domain-containing protein n=1 Tax=Psychrosphaera ytuae TaxID=2820710 RepID=A0A975DAS7_9GAMM|nr:BON domain-containing protein [Psychrosphaera ytuae]QTH63755.1 BON domain-containing protein [Psychrosphaera ytuae]
MKTFIKTLSAFAIAGALGLSAPSTASDWKDKSRDAWLDGKAETILLMNTNLNSFDINTDVRKGVVTLTGDVNNEMERELAEELVMTLDGVKSVKNRLVIIDDNRDDNSNDSTLTDAKVEAVIETRYLLDSEVSALDIDVEAENGVVTLSGMVSSDTEHDLAIAIAENTDDVKRVIDDLQVVSD